MERSSMSTRDCCRRLPALLAGSLAATLIAANADETPIGLGRPVATGAMNSMEASIFPDGTGLPPGHGSAPQGQVIYERRCAHCHGERGRGGSAEELAGAAHDLRSSTPDKTIGSYWPYATTIFDFIRRSMPLDAPRSLSDDEVYAVTAYLLHINGIIAADQSLDAGSLPQVRMPNRDGFIAIDVAPPSSNGIR